MWFKISYCIYLIISLFYATVPLVGPLSIRHVFTLFMLFACFTEGGLKLDKFLKWYLVFLFFYTLVEVATGFALFVITKLLGTYLASIALYMATKIMIKKYDAGGLIIKVLVIAGIVNSIVAIGQFYGISIAELIPEALHITLSEEELELLDRENFHGYNVGGLLGAVCSGYFLSATAVLALYNKNNKISVFNWAAFVVIFFALFLVQERSGLAAGFLCAFLFLVVFSIRNKNTLIYSILILVAIAFIIVYVGSRYISYEEMRYTTKGLEDSGRTGYFFTSLIWVFSQSPLGGANYFYSQGGYYPHNIIANALLYGGIFGGTVLICILIAQLVKIGRVFLSYIKGKKYPVLLIVSCAAYLSYTINSFFHNTSLVFASETIFLLWAMITSLIEKEKRKLLKRRLLKRKLL